jgi:peptidoglycan/LPS O-acetylase OafA/YrhL
MLMLSNLLTGVNAPNVTWTLSYEMVFYLLIAALFSWNLHRHSGTWALTWAAVALGLGGILPMAAITDWAGRFSNGQLAMNLIADALILTGIILAASERGKLARIGAAVAALVAVVLVTVNSTYPYPWSSGTILGLMFTGTLIYRAEQGQVSKRRAAVIAVIVLAALVAAGLWHGFRYGGTWRAQWTSSLVLAAVTFGLGLACRKFRIPNVLAWLGLVSYSVYLLHPLIFDAYRDIPALHRAHPMSTQIWLALALLAVILAASAATYYGVEKPMQRLGRVLARRLSGRAQLRNRCGPSALNCAIGVATVRSIAQSVWPQRAQLRNRAAAGVLPLGLSRGAEDFQQRGGGRRVRRLAVADRDDRTAGATQAHRADAGVAGGAERESGQQREAESGTDQGLDGDEVVGGEGHLRGEAGGRALLEQVLPAAVAAGDPALGGEPGQIGGPHLRESGGRKRLAVGRGVGGSDQVNGLVEEHLLAEVGFVRRGLALREFGVVAEDQRDVHVAGAEHAERFGRLGLGQPEVHARVLVAQHRRGDRHDRAERGRERGQPQAPRAQPAVDGEFVLGGVETAYDFGGPFGEEAASVRQADAAPGPLDQLGAGLRFEPGKVMAHGGLRVVEGVSGPGDRSVPGHCDQHPEPRYVQHGLTIDGTDLSAQTYTRG